MKTYPFDPSVKKGNVYPKNDNSVIIKRFKNYCSGKYSSLIEYDFNVLEEYFPEQDREQLRAMCDSVSLAIVRFDSHNINRVHSDFEEPEEEKKPYKNPIWLSWTLRILSLPFVMCLFIISLTVLFFKMSYFHVKYGGEFIQYTKDHSPATIGDIMNLLKEKL